MLMLPLYLHFNKKSDYDDMKYHLPLWLCLKIAGRVANRVDPREMLHSAASHLGLHCLLGHVCPNTYCKYCKPVFSKLFRQT